MRPTPATTAPPPARVVGPRRIPPGPGGRPLVGNLLEFGRDLLGFLSGLARDYGDIARFRLANYPSYFLNHPDSIEAVLVTQNQNFEIGRASCRERVYVLV